MIPGMELNGDYAPAVPGSRGRDGGSRTRTAIVGVVSALILALTLLACPIQRPLLPESYPGFRYDLELAVQDTAMAVLAGRPAERRRLEGWLTERSSLVVVDSLVSKLRSDRQLGSLGLAVDAVLEARLSSDAVDGSVREAYRTPPGQRLAADAIVVGLGRAIYLLKERDPE